MNSTEIEKSLLDLTKKTIQEDSKSRGRGKSIHVTSITGPCLRKTWYGMTEKEQPIDYETAAVFRVGTIVHESITLSKDKNEYKMAGNVREMKPLKPSDITFFNFLDCISGTADDIIEVNGELVIVDKKTISTVTKSSMDRYFSGESKVVSLWFPKEASSDYIFQLNEYALLYYINHGVIIKKGAIIYLDMATRFREPRVFEVNLWDIDTIKKKVLDKLDGLREASKSNIAPERHIDWHCRFCPFRDSVCHPQEDPKYTELIKNG